MSVNFSEYIKTCFLFKCLLNGKPKRSPVFWQISKRSGNCYFIFASLCYLKGKCTFPCSIACRCNIVLFSSISTPNDSNESSFASISRPNDSNGFARAQYKARKEPTPWYQSRGEEFTPLYEPYSYMLPLRIWFLHRFGLKTGIEFAHLDLEWVMFF